MFLEPLTITSVIVSSDSSGSIGPRPRIPAPTCSESRGGTRVVWPRSECRGGWFRPLDRRRRGQAPRVDLGIGPFRYVSAVTPPTSFEESPSPSGASAAERPRPLDLLYLFLFFCLGHQLVLDRPHQIENVARRRAALVAEQERHAPADGGRHRPFVVGGLAVSLDRKRT